MFCKNARIHNDIRLANLLAELAHISWDVVCFSESQAAAGDHLLSGGHRLITHKGSTYGGVAVLIHSQYGQYVVSHHSFGDRVLAVRVGDFGARLCIISVYVPHAGYSMDDVIETYNQLCIAVAWGRKYTNNITIGGDFNTSISSGLRSHLLFGFLAEQNLTIANEQLEESILTKYTFRSSLGAKRQLDYILYSCNVEKVKGNATDDLCLGSDHRAVEATLAVKVGRLPGNKFRPEFIDSRRWKPSETFQQAIDSALAKGTANNVIRFQSILVETAEAHCTTTEKSHSETQFDSPCLRALRFQRKVCGDSTQRKELSKKI